MKKLMLFLLALVIVAGLVVMMLPARLVVGHVLPADAGVQLQDVSGTVWNGRAGRLIHRGNDLGVLAWQVQKRALLNGLVSADVTLDGNDHHARGRVSRSKDGVIHLSDVDGEFVAARLAPLLDIPALNLHGRVAVRLDTLQLRGRVPLALQGHARWQDAAVSGAENASFGPIVAHFGPQGGGFGGRVNDEGGPLEVNGEFKTTLMGYEAHAVLRPRDGNPQIANILRHIGQPQPDGSVQFHVRGGLRGRSS